MVYINSFLNSLYFFLGKKTQNQAFLSLINKQFCLYGTTEKNYSASEDDV